MLSHRRHCQSVTRSTQFHTVTRSTQFHHQQRHRPNKGPGRSRYVDRPRAQTPRASWQRPAHRLVAHARALAPLHFTHTSPSCPCAPKGAGDRRRGARRGASRRATLSTTNKRVGRAPRQAPRRHVPRGAQRPPGGTAAPHACRLTCATASVMYAGTLPSTRTAGGAPSAARARARRQPPQRRRRGAPARLAAAARRGGEAALWAAAMACARRARRAAECARRGAAA